MFEIANAKFNLHHKLHNK